MRSAITPGPYIPHHLGPDVEAHYANHRGWITGAVHTSIPWPERDVMVRYDGNDYFLRGLRQAEDRLGEPCISMRLGNGLDRDGALSLLYQFTSILGWYLRGYVDIVGFITASHASLYSDRPSPSGVTMQGGPHGFDCNYMPLLRDPLTKRALAFWREGEKLRRVHDGYAFLSYYKVIESQFTQSKGRERGNWINGACDKLTCKAAERVAELRAMNVEVGEYLYHEGRAAIAHAHDEAVIVDPDVPADRVRIAQDLPVMRGLAEKYICDVLGVPDNRDVYASRDRLAPLHPYMTSAHLEELRRGGSVLKRKLGLNGLRVSVNLWPLPAAQALTELVLTVEQAHNGMVVLVARPEIGGFRILFVVNFMTGKADPDILSTGADLPVRVKDAVPVHEYKKAALANGLVELTLPSGEKLQCEEVLPVNIDIGGTIAMWERELAKVLAAASEQ